MSKHAGASERKPAALMLMPEAPYPLSGGGQMRTASLLLFLAERYDVDLILFREQGQDDPQKQIPAGLARSVHLIDLPFHSRSAGARAVRNALRFARRASPLVDRFAGFDERIEAAIAGRHYSLGVIEHFWCAPYLNILKHACDRIVLDLHNIESILLKRCSSAQSFPRATFFARFADATARLERDLLPGFTALLVPSEHDAEQLAQIAPGVPAIVYPNAVPFTPEPHESKNDAIVFSGNLEYEPNRTAISHFHRAIWPSLKQRWPALRWRLIGRNHTAVQAQLLGDDRVEVVGPVEDAVRELASAKVAIAPLLAGSGTRIKIIEAWAAGLAVVSTSLGAEGLPCIPGEHLLIADSPAGFSEAVSQLLSSDELRMRLGANGRKLYEESLTWPAVWQRLQTAGL